MSEAGFTPRELSIIDEAVKRTVTALHEERRHAADDAYKQTMRRLKALPIIKERLEENKARLEGMRADGALPGVSKSIIRYSAAGLRVDPEEMYEAACLTLEAHIAADQLEVEEVAAAMKTVQQEAYYAVIYDYYVKNMSDLEIAEKLFCDESTVRRRRSQLVHRIAIRLYGAYAL